MLITLWHFLTGPDIDGFEQHLIDAIALNTVRCADYGALTDGESDALFASLISSERLIRPVARYLDARAVPFVADGVGVVVGDFVPMSGVSPISTPVAPTSPMRDETQEAARVIIAQLLQDSASRDGFAVVDACAAALESLEALEAEEAVYFAMSRHVIESVGLAALHGLYTRCETGGAVDDLVASLVAVQRMGLVRFDVTDYDAQANVFHRQGIGVLVNDLPMIPFLSEHETFQERDRADLEACLR